MLSQVAHQLKVDSGILEEMITFWVRKGKLREIGNLTACSSCGGVQGCPFIVTLPRCYELVRENPACSKFQQL